MKGEAQNNPKRFLFRGIFILSAPSYLVKESIHNVQMLRWVGGKDTSSAIFSRYEQLVVSKIPDGI